MICPICDAINKDNARVCASCGCRLNSRQPSPGAVQAEKKYLLAGSLAMLAIVAFVVLMISSLSCICGGCSPEGAPNAVVGSVEGDWDAEPVSDSNASATDVAEEESVEPVESNE